MSRARLEVSWATSVWTRALEALLDQTERDRLSRLRQADDRRRFVAAHALLRLIVADATGTPADQLEFRAECRTCGGPHGKPSPVGLPGLHVSLAHAGDRVVVARTEAGPVGVDVEPLAPVDVDSFDRVALTPAERAALACLRPGVRDDSRLACWVRKEAVLKATGHGLSTAPADVVVSLPPDPPRLISWTAPDPPATAVHLPDIAVGDRYLGCVAVLAGDPVPVSVTDATDRLTCR